MAKQRSTFGKIQREQEKRAKAQAKRERRAQRAASDETDGTEETPRPTVDQAAILDALARLYEQYENGELETDDFEIKRDELRAQIDLG